MRSKFPGYYKLSEAEVKQIFKGALIVLDANVLLNLYRYSKETAESLLGLLEKWADRIWLPHQVALEYHRGRLGVISEQSKAYAEAARELSEAVEPFEEERRHPYIGKDKLEELKQVITKITKELDASKESLRALLDEDWVLERVTRLFDGKVGEPFTADEADRARGEGARRQAERRPPGFKDKDEGKPAEQRFGDYILWRQMLRRGASEKNDVVFVTDDVKEDWWRIHEGKRLGPRPELVEEFREEAGKRFLMWTTARLLGVGKQQGESVAQAAIDEAKQAASGPRAHVSQLMQIRLRAMMELEELVRAVAAQQRAVQVAEERVDMATHRVLRAAPFWDEPGGEEEHRQRVRERGAAVSDLKRAHDYLSQTQAMEARARRIVAETETQLRRTEKTGESAEGAPG